MDWPPRTHGTANRVSFDASCFQMWGMIPWEANNKLFFRAFEGTCSGVGATLPSGLAQVSRKLHGRMVGSRSLQWIDAGWTSLLHRKTAWTFMSHRKMVNCRNALNKCCNRSSSTSWFRTSQRRIRHEVAVITWQTHYPMMWWMIPCDTISEAMGQWHSNDGWDSL